jgi:predicted nucleic acid-binding protein
MGLILDSSVLITAERQGQNARQMLSAIGRTARNTDIAISVVTLIELAHGAARADTAQRKESGTSSSMNCLWPCPFIRSRDGRSSRWADRR